MPVKELTIEWQDYQTEVSGYITCKACADLIDGSPWYKHVIEDTELREISMVFIES